MARDKFHPGQRVIWTVGGHEYSATVLAARELLPHVRTGKRSLVYRLELDGYGTHHAKGTLYAAPERELRPIYDGDQPCSWAQCAWKPQGERVTR